MFCSKHSLNTSFHMRAIKGLKVLLFKGQISCKCKSSATNYETEKLSVAIQNYTLQPGEGMT